VAEDTDEVAAQLRAVAERLADLAIDRLRRATDPEEGDRQAQADEERRITRARRAVEKAATLLDPIATD
jgi:hypothetical protein